MKRKKWKKGTGRLLCLMLAAAVIWASLLPSEKASAAEVPTSLSFAQFGIDAYRDGWKYSYGGTGETYNGVRYSDCSGLIYAYFSDLGVAGCQRTVSQQVNGNCIFNNDISEGIPNIHGLTLTKPDYNAPETGVYGHVGIYIGGGEAVDNSDSTYNMRRDPVVGAGRNWNAWHLFDNGMLYPVNGWYELDGKMVHYTNFEYDTDCTIDGYTLDSAGYAVDSDGYAPVDKSILSDKYVPASQVKAYLSTKYSGVDTTASLVNSGGSVDPYFEYNGKVTGSGVRVRKEANTQSEIIVTLSLGTGINIQSEATGENVTADGSSSNLWYFISTASGKSGYISALYVEKVFTGAEAPVITAEDGYVTITANDGADIYYTVDNTVPSESSTPYIGPVYLVGRTYQAIAVKNGQKSEVTRATVLSNSAVFCDFTTKDWFYSAVDEAVAAGIFHGRGNGIFDPNVEITRAEFVTALAGLDGVDLSAYSGETGFLDVTNPSSTMTKAIQWAMDKGYVHGYGDEKFHPNDCITREQMCVILASYAGLKASEEPQLFEDDGAISGWAKDAVYACREVSVISGVGGNSFSPKGNATRSQACVVMVALSKLDVPSSAASATPDQDSTVSFSNS